MDSMMNYSTNQFSADSSHRATGSPCHSDAYLREINSAQAWRMRNLRDETLPGFDGGYVATDSEAPRKQELSANVVLLPDSRHPGISNNAINENPRTGGNPYFDPSQGMKRDPQGNLTGTQFQLPLVLPHNPYLYTVPSPYSVYSRIPQYPLYSQPPSQPQYSPYPVPSLSSLISLAPLLIQPPPKLVQTLTPERSPNNFRSTHVPSMSLPIISYNASNQNLAPIRPHEDVNIKYQGRRSTTEKSFKTPVVPFNGLYNDFRQTTHSRRNELSAPNSYTANTFSPIRRHNSSTSTLIYHNNNYPINQLVPERLPLALSRQLQEDVYPTIEIKKYSTSAIDPVRNYLTVYEYPIFNHWVIWDYETGFVHLTGIWKASLSASHPPVAPSFLSHKADIVKLLDSTPKQYHQYIKRIRGGFLKIQGTWLPYKLCRLLARRFCYHIRHELIPIFGADFPDFCLKPTERGFGELKLDEVPEEIRYSATVPPYHSNEAPSVRRKRLGDDVGPLEKRKRPSMDGYTGKFDSTTSLKNEHGLKPNFQLIRWPQDPSAPVLMDSPLITGKRASSPALATHDENDMIEIVNASKCLQSLSKSSQSSPIANSTSSDNAGNIRTNSTSSDSAPSYTITSVPHTYPLTPSGGISSILVAAGLSEPPSLPHISSDKTPYRRSSMKINDLLT